MARQPPPQWARAPSFSRIHDHTQTHHSRYDSSGRVISPTQRLLPENIQHSQQKASVSPVGFESTVEAGERPQTHTFTA